MAADVLAPVHLPDRCRRGEPAAISRPTPRGRKPIQARAGYCERQAKPPPPRTEPARGSRDEVPREVAASRLHDALLGMILEWHGHAAAGTRRVAEVILAVSPRRTCRRPRRSRTGPGAGRPLRTSAWGAAEGGNGGRIGSTRPRYPGDWSPSPEVAGCVDFRPAADRRSLGLDPWEGSVSTRPWWTRLATPSNVSRATPQWTSTSVVFSLAACSLPDYAEARRHIVGRDRAVARKCPVPTLSRRILRQARVVRPGHLRPSPGK